MDHLHFHSQSSSSLSSPSTDSDELTQIVELPTLETTYDALELVKDFVFTDSEDGWMYEHPSWLQSMDDSDAYVADQLWNY